MLKKVKGKVLKKLVQNNKKSNDIPKSFNNNRIFLGLNYFVKLRGVSLREMQYFYRYLSSGTKNVIKLLIFSF